MRASKPRWPRPSRALGLITIAVALGGVTLVVWPASARPGRPVGPRFATIDVPPRFGLAPDFRGPVFPSELAPSLGDDLRPTDRCLIPAPQVDERFAVPAPQVDDRFVVAPKVVGVPVSPRTWVPRR